MPRAFTETEKEIIRKQMREKGKILFEKQGIRKTTIEELSLAAGISKGAFYKFYDSKEELYLEILEEFEREIQLQIIQFAVDPGDDAQENLLNLLRNLFLTMDDYPILENIHSNDVEYLTRRIPAERIQQHAAGDREFAAGLMNKFNQEGITLTASPRVISNLLKGIFFIWLHREDFEKDEFEELFNTLLSLAAGYITGKIQ
ncbi:MAG: TetR/AcrR family transcriptional regulator [Anaerolineales bacterium]|nr:TetR/AcrR family transcriptional regulator [Anaerolineales bacterium]